MGRLNIIMLYHKFLKYLIIVLIFLCLISLKATSNSNLSQIYLERAKLFYQTGFTNEAIEECEKILIAQPDHEEAQSIITEIKSKFKDSETPYLLFIGEFGPQGFQDGELSTSITLTVDDEDNVYVADRYNHNIQKFNSQGNLLLTFSKERNKRDNFFRPIDLGYQNNTIFVVDSFYHEIRQFSLDGIPLKVINIKYIDKPIGIAVDEELNIFLLDSTKVQKLNLDGELEKTFGENILLNPKEITLNSEGNILIVDVGKNPLKLFDKNGYFVGQFGDNTIEEPVGIAEDKEGNFLLIDQAKDKMLGFDAKGKFLTQYPINQTKLINPLDIATSPHNLVYIAHQGKNRILEFQHKYARSKEEHFALGELYLAEQINLSAIEEFQKAIRLGLDTSRVYYLLGRAYHQEGKWEQAINEYEKAIQIKPQAEIYFYGGNAYYANHLYQKAAQNFQQALLLDPKDINSLNNLGYSYLNLDQLNDALKIFTEVLIIDSNYIEALIGRGIIFYKNKEYEQAINEYKKVLEIDSTNKKVNYYLGQSYYADGKYNEAIKTLEKASAEGPYFVDSLYYLGLAYQEIGETDQAIEIFQSALMIAPGREDIRQALFKIKH
jgi:tetratricopeptide (TPR) repeat protein